MSCYQLDAMRFPLDSHNSLGHGDECIKRKDSQEAKPTPPHFKSWAGVEYQVGRVHDDVDL